MAEQINLNAYETVFNMCLDYYDSKGNKNAFTLMSSIMDTPSFPMHYPVHHYLTAAVLLTVCRKQQEYNRALISRDLKTAMDRALQVPGGSCGFLGCCGAAVGVGIFWSLITDSSPLSVKSWAYGNRATGEALIAMAEQGGPRCCKRCSYTAVLSSLKQIKEVLGLTHSDIAPICHYHENNKECIQKRCTFYPSKNGEQ